MIRAALFAALLLPGAALSQTSVPEPQTYREEEYRAPVPDTLAGATTVEAPAAFALWKTGRVAFIDVLPRPPKPKKLPAGTIWREKPRPSIPGALWLPNVGYGRIPDIMETYFREGLTKATGGDTSAPVVFFCLESCWMSWNAAKRALEWGYTNVFWFPGGTDTWEFEDYPLEEVTAEPEP